MRASKLAPVLGDQDDRVLRARGLGFLFAAGATIVVLSLALPRDDEIEAVGLLVPALLAYLGAGALVASGGRLGTPTLHGFLALGTALIAACVVNGGASATAYLFMFLWVALYAAAFFRPVEAAMQVLLCVGAYGVALAFSDHVHAPSVHWLVATGTLVVTAAFISALADAARVRAADLALLADVGTVADVNEIAAVICQGLRRSAAADVVLLLEPLDDGGGLQVTGMAGTSGNAVLLNGPHALAAIERAYTGGEPQAVTLDHAPGVLGGTQFGLVQPVLHDGRPVGVLALAWSRPRRRVTERVATAALLFAGEAAAALERQQALTREKERHALEINDNIVQGLVVAKYAAVAGNTTQALQAIDDTLARARRLITAQLDDVRGGSGEVRPGDLVRREASEL